MNLTLKLKKRTPVYLSNEKGMVLPVGLVLMLLLAIMGSASVLVIRTDTKISGNYKTVTTALNLAEGGVAHGERTLKDDSDWDALLEDSPFTCPGLSGCSYAIENDAGDFGGPTDDTNNSVIVIATGQSGSSTKEIEAVVQRDAPLFRDALFGLEFVEVSGGVGTDSYDSRNGPYDPATAGSEGDVGSNGDIEISNAATLVMGDASAEEIDIGGGATVTGTVTEDAPPQSVPSIPDCGPPFSPDVGISGDYDYDPATGVLAVIDGNSITLADGTYCFSRVTLSGGGDFTVNGPVNMYLTDYAAMSGGSLINTTGEPADFEIYSSFDGDYGRDEGHGGVELSGGGQAYMIVYAPDTFVEVSGGSDFYGAIVGKTIETSGGTQFHYDEKLGAGGGGSGVVIVSWKENF